jgi:hypothetical protein
VIPQRPRAWRLAASVGLVALATPLLPAPAGASPGQEVTDLNGGIAASDLANDLAGTGVTVSDVVYTGGNQQAGRFSGLGAVGFDAGIVLSTGQAIDVVGPNELDDTGALLGGPGDSDLDTIVAPNLTEDASVLEFTFVPSTDTVSFDYVFASEEYTEFVDSEFNDVFAFYVNGSNCATIGTDPVSVNSINPGRNAESYRDNRTDPTAIDTEFDGLTTVLTCTATVDAGAANTLKLAIADTSDQDLDSAVFLRASSLQAQLPPTCVGAVLNTRNDQDLAVVLTAADPNGDPLTFTIDDTVDNGTLSGTAPNLTYRANAGFTGLDQLTFTVSDGINEQTCTAQIDINVVAPPPPPRPAPVTPSFTG